MSAKSKSYAEQISNAQVMSAGLCALPFATRDGADTDRFGCLLDCFVVPPRNDGLRGIYVIARLQSRACRERSVAEAIQ